MPHDDKRPIGKAAADVRRRSRKVCNTSKESASLRQWLPRSGLCYSQCDGMGIDTGRRRLGFLAALLLLAATSVLAQSFGAKGFQAKGFKVAEPYGPPHENQIKSLREGGKAQPLPGGRTLLSDGMILRTF